VNDGGTGGATARDDQFTYLTQSQASVSSGKCTSPPSLPLAPATLLLCNSFPRDQIDLKFSKVDDDDDDVVKIDEFHEEVSTGRRGHEDCVSLWTESRLCLVGSSADAAPESTAAAAAAAATVRAREHTLAYYEVTVMNLPTLKRVAVGVALDPIAHDVMITEDDDDKVRACAYVGDGRVRMLKDDEIVEQCAPMARSGDVVGCGVTSSGNVFFTLNGTLLCTMPFAARGSVHAAISIMGAFGKLRYNFGAQRRFEYDADALLFAGSDATLAWRPPALRVLLNSRGGSANIDTLARVYCTARDAASGAATDDDVCYVHHVTHQLLTAALRASPAVRDDGIERLEHEHA